MLLRAKVIRNSFLCLLLHVIQDGLHFLCIRLKMNTVLIMALKSVSVVVALHYDYYNKLHLSLAKNITCLMKIVILLLSVEVFI